MRFIAQIDEDLQPASDLASRNLSVFSLIVIGSLIYLAWRNRDYFKRLLPTQYISPKYKSSAILLSYYTKNTKVEPVQDWKIDDMHVQAMLITNPTKGLKTSGLTLLIRVELPFRTNVHLLGIPKNPDVISLDPTFLNSAMEEVVLEGDYPEYFRLFADIDQQVESRYHIDPVAMAFTVDFCRSHNWEIIEDELYFVQSTSSQHIDDPTNMVHDVAAFVEAVRPSIEVPNTDEQEVLRTPYGRERRKSLDCPVCGKPMEKADTFFSCVDNHGILLTGLNLKKMRADGAVFVDSEKARHTEDIISCPSCGEPMLKVRYAGGNTIIDSCTNCPYRWLDNGEILNDYETQNAESA